MVEKIYTTSTAAKALGVSQQTIRAWIKKGAIKPMQAVKLGWYRFTESEINRVKHGE